VQELEEQERLAATADVEEEMETGEVGALDTTNKKGNKKQKKKKAPVWKQKYSNWNMKIVFLKAGYFFQLFSVSSFHFLLVLRALS
jgi:hypothetical protein